MKIMVYPKNSDNPHVVEGKYAERFQASLLNAGIRIL